MTKKGTIITVSGPTACGKTAFGIALAHRYGGEVVSIDSMQIYKGLTIGTAAPTEEEMEGVPHHMVGIADVTESWSAARFVEAAAACIDDILKRGKRPILVGGTGLYLDAILTGRTFAPGSSGGAIRAELTKRLAEEGVDALLKELSEVDPEAAQRLHRADTKRIIRALEVYRETGKTITEHNRETQLLPRPYDAVSFALTYENREDLKERIDLRVDKMVEMGLLDEVKWLLTKPLPPDATALQAIGYKEFAGYLKGEATLEEAIAEVKLRSRQYAKRQLTWLRRKEDLTWILWERERDLDKALQKATKTLAAHGL